MSLLSQNLAIVPTPSLVLDGHYPDGNDGTVAIPLTWATIPSFLLKQEGSSFSVNVRTGYLTEPGSPNATITLLSGTLPTGWSLSSAGALAYNGTGQGAATIRVRATRSGVTSDSNPFTVESIALIVSADSQAPTIPTGLALVSKTTTTITVTNDASSDVPTATIPADGMKETRYFVGGVFDAATAMSSGLTLRLARKDYSPASKRYFHSNKVAISEGQRASAGGVPNPTSISTVGPCAPGVSSLVMRYRWRDLETSAGVYNLTKIIHDVGQAGVNRIAAGLPGVGIFAMIVSKDFSANSTGTFVASVGGALLGNFHPQIANGTYGALFSNNESRICTITTGPTVTIGGVATPTSHAVWSVPLAAGSVTTADFNPVSNNPLPTYLQAYADVFSSNTGGWNTRRHDPTVLNAWDGLMKAIGAALDANIWFAGVATQETSTGGTAPPSAGYTQAAYEAGLMAEHDSIQRWCPSTAHKAYINFMGGSHTTDIAHLQAVIAHLALDGAYVGNPDLCPGNAGLCARYDAFLTPYQDATGLVTQAGPTFSSVQNAEWTGIVPADNRTMQQLWDYGQGIIADDRGPTHKPCHLSGWVVDWHPAKNALGENFTNAAAPIFAAHPDFNHFTAPGSITAGTLAQSGVDYNLTSYGTGVGPTADNWSSGSIGVNGNGTIIVKLNAITGSDTTAAIAGISFRETQSDSSRAVHLYVTPTQIRARYRPSLGSALSDVLSVAGSWSSAKWLKIKRAGNVFTFSYASSANSWVSMGTVTLPMVPAIYAELFASCVGKATSITAAFKQVNINNLAPPTKTYSGLTPATSYDLTAKARDNANNDSAASDTLTVVTS